MDWADPANAPAKPSLLGTKVYQDFPIEELLPYIDWNPFFQVCACSCLWLALESNRQVGQNHAHVAAPLPMLCLTSNCRAPTLPGCLQVWQLRGRYPNRGYPKIFNDETVGSEAKKLFDEAQAMLQVGAGESGAHWRHMHLFILWP